MKIPDVENSLSQKSKKMKIRNQMDNEDFGKKSKIVNRKVEIRSSGKDHTLYGSRTIATKESFTNFLFNEAESSTELTLLPMIVIAELKKLISKGAKDLEQDWANALELTHTAYHVASVRLPAPDQKGAWEQYEDLLTFAVKQLMLARGPAGKWRMSEVLLKESTSNRFFVEMPNQASVEIEAESMDDIIDQLSNKLRRHGTKLRVDQRSLEGATLSVWKDDVQYDTITIKDIS